MADFIRPTPQNPTLGAIARALSGVHEFAARPFGYANPPGAMLSELLGVPATARTVERLSYGEPLTTGAGGIGGTTRPREDTVDAAMTVTPLAHVAGRVAGRGAMALGRAGERLAERAVPPIMERGGKGAELLQALGQGTTSNVVKPKGGNWVIGSVEKTTDPLKTRIGPTAFGMEAGSTDPARRIADLQASRAQNIEAGVPVDEERMAELMRLLEPKAAINRWLETKLGKYMRNEMGTPQDPLRLQADEFAAKREQLLAQKDAQIAKATADMEAARAARGFTPEMMTQSQARIRELQKERAFIEAQTGLHFEPEASAVRAHGKRHLAGMPTEPTSQTPYGMAWEDVADASILPGNYRDMTSMSDGRAMPDKLRELGGEFAVKNPTAQAYEIDRATSAQNLGFDHLMDELRNALDPNSGLPEKLRLSVDDIEKLTVPRAVKLVDEINAWRSVQQAEANKAIAGNAATQVIKEYPESGLKWVELKVPEQKKTELPTGWRVQKDLNSRGEDYYYVVNEQGEPFPGSGWIGDSPEKARANALEDLNKKDLEDALKYEGEMLKHCVGGYCPDVVSGKSRIMSLRDAEGRPRVTIEVQPERNPYLSSSGNISDAGLQKIRSMFPESNFDLEYGEWFKNSDQHSMHFAKEYAPWIQRTYPEIYEATIGAPLKQNVQQIKAKSNAKASGADVEYVKDFLNSQPFGTVKDLPHDLVDLQDPNSLMDALKTLYGDESNRRIGQEFVDAFNHAVGVEPNAPRFMTQRQLREFIGPVEPLEGYGGGGLVKSAVKGIGEMVEKYLAKEAPQVAEQKMLQGVYRGYAGEAPGETVYHAGAEFTQPNPGLFTNPERAAVEQFQRFTGAPKLHTLEAKPRRTGTDEDVYAMARRLGIYNPGVPASQYIEQGESAIFPEAARMVEELRGTGLDSLRLKDGMGKQPSLVALDPNVVRPAPELYATPQRRVADYYAQKRAAQTGEQPHVEMVLVDPFAGRAYGHSTMGTGKQEPMTTRARKLKPEDVRSRTQLYAEGGEVVGSDQDGVNRMVALEQGGVAGYAAGGWVNYDPNEIDTIVSRVKEEFHG